MLIKLRWSKARIAKKIFTKCIQMKRSNPDTVYQFQMVLDRFYRLLGQAPAPYWEPYCHFLQITAKLAARAGFQWIIIDMEHWPFTPEQATQLVHAVIAAFQGACSPLIRVPSHGTEWIKWTLDSGTAGTIVPVVHNAAEMEDIIPSCGKNSCTFRICTPHKLI